MKYLTLDLAKQHLRTDGDDEDALIEFLIGAAEEAAIKQVNRNVYETQAELDAADDPDGIVITQNIRAAMLLIVGSLYANREAVVVGSGITPHELPLGVTWLLRHDRKVPGL